MNIKYILRRMGLIKTPHYSVDFAANNPFKGTWFCVRFEDGRQGMVIAEHNGTYKACPEHIRDRGCTFVNIDDAVESVYSELLRTP